jgi:hypothetical protein
MAFTKKHKQYSVLFTLVLLVSYFTFFDDYFKYLEVKKNGTSDACISYYLAFPNGFFTEDVKVIEIEDSRDIVLVRDFIDDYPNSKHSSVELINLELWNDEIRRYDSIVVSNDRFDQDAVEFFRILLNYMRDENKSTIYFNLSGDTKVTNFEFYSSNIVSLMDEVYYATDYRNITGNIEDISSNYSSGDIDTYENIIISSINNIFENILSDKFITVKSIDGINDQYSDKLYIDINYNIKNQEDLYEGDYYPAIWEYFNTTSSGSKSFISYFIGIAIDFEFSFKIPETSKTYQFKQSANPLTEINNITSLKDAYRGLTKQNFQDFADEISNNFGIYTTIESE